MMSEYETTRRNFRVRRRRESENLFVRLSPNQIQDLKSDISVEEGQEAFHERSWNYLADKGDVNFLPLELSWDGGSSSIYASYNGGISKQGTICIVIGMSFYWANERSSYDVKYGTNYVEIIILLPSF
jgi:hypothetical protein